ncbi:hypothetical protein AIZ02_23330, partial [Salmonella enterica subsp. enterica serovar Typhimurium]
KSAQIREILISESAWEEMTCLFAPSLDESVSISQMVKSYCADKKSTPRLIAKITDRVERIIAEDDDADGEYIKGLIEIEYERNKKL